MKSALRRVTLLVFIILLGFTIGSRIAWAQGGSVTVQWGDQGQEGPPEKYKKGGKKGGPPPHAPAHGYRAKHQYRYYPCCSTYYDADRGMWFYIKTGDWAIGVSIPTSLKAQLGHYVNISMDTDRPYEFNDFFRSGPDGRPDARIHAHDPAVIIYTSGTTARPKGAVLTHGNLVHDAKNIMTIWEIKESDVLCHALPLFHVHGLCFALHVCLLAGSHVLLLDAFTPETVVTLLAGREGNPICSVFMAVPSMYARMMDFAEGKALSFDKVRLWTSGSAPLLPKDFERIKRTFGKEPVEREGMSETGMNFSNPLRGDRKPGSIGVPLPGLEVRIVNPETLREVAPGETGEIWLKGPAVTPGYWQKPEETAKTFVEGWFRSGDLGRIDEEGYYYLTDRLKHIIISGGENISPKEVEAVINRMDGVGESCVVGVPDEKWGEAVKAIVVLHAGKTATEKELINFVKERKGSLICPKTVEFWDAIPLTNLGKIDKKKIRENYWKGYERRV